MSHFTGTLNLDKIDKGTIRWDLAFNNALDKVDALFAGTTASKLSLGDTSRSAVALSPSGTEKFSVDDTGLMTKPSPTGGEWRWQEAEEEITLNTSGTTTDSVANLLPVDALIEAVTARVTAEITGATDWSVGDANVAARFIAAQTGLTAGTTNVGLQHWRGSVSTDNAGPHQAAAAKVRITTTGTPTAGKIRVSVRYLQFTPSTS